MKIVARDSKINFKTRVQLEECTVTEQGKQVRQYVRLDTVLQVDFSLATAEGEKKFYQGVTSNISHGGITLEVNESINEPMNE